MTDTLTKHYATPLPWEADDDYIVGRVRGGRPNGETIFQSYRREMPREERLANALLVAEAVNNHEKNIARIAELERERDEWILAHKEQGDRLDAAECELAHAYWASCGCLAGGMGHQEGGPGCRKRTVPNGE